MATRPYGSCLCRDHQGVCPPPPLECSLEGDVGRLAPRGDRCALAAIWIGLATNTRHLPSSEHTWHGYALQCLPVLCLLLSGRAGWLPFLVLPAGIIIELLTTSRATIGLALLGYSVVFVLSAVRSWTSRKAITLMVAVAMGAVVTPVALSAIASRGSDKLEGSNEERVALESAASMMLSDYPLGVGANNFVTVANTQGYYQRAGVGWYSYGAIVHNVYWLVAAETGYLGLIVFAMFLLNPMIVAIWCGLRNPKDVRGDLLIGLGAALIVEYLHCLVEWVFVTDPLNYAFAMDVGLVAGLAIQLGYWRQKRAKSPFSLSKSGPAQGPAARRREVAPRSGTAVGGS